MVTANVCGMDGLAGDCASTSNDRTISGGLTLRDLSLAVCENTVAGDPSAMILPSASSTMRSAISASSSLAWLAIITVSPF